MILESLNPLTWLHLPLRALLLAYHGICLEGYESLVNSRVVLCHISKWIFLGPNLLKGLQCRWKRKVEVGPPMVSPVPGVDPSRVWIDHRNLSVAGPSRVCMPLIRNLMHN